MYLKWYGEDGKPVIKSFATGKTLGESGSDMDRMFLISSAITKAFHGEQGAYARYRQMEDSTKAEGVVLHLSPKEQRVLMDALLEQRMRQEAQMTNTEQLLRRMTGSITAYMDEVGARPLRMSTADRAVLAIRDGELYAFSSLAVQITKPEERGSLLAAAAGRPGPVGKRMARLMLGTKSPYPEDVWLDACKRAVDTGDLQRVQMMLDQTMDKVANPSPALPGEVLRYAFGQNRAMARELIRWATPEQVAAAPSRLLCGAAYAHDLPMLTELRQKGLQPGDQAAPLLRPLLAAYDEQRVAHLLRAPLPVKDIRDLPRFGQTPLMECFVRLRPVFQDSVKTPLPLNVDSAALPRPPEGKHAFPARLLEIPLHCFRPLLRMRASPPRTAPRPQNPRRGSAFRA